MAIKVWPASGVAVVILSVGPSVGGSRAFGAARPSVQADAEEHIKRGLELRRKGEDAAGLAAFDEGMRRSPSARAKGQVGLAQMAVGLFEAAEVTLSDLLSSSEDDSWVSDHRAV